MQKEKRVQEGKTPGGHEEFFLYDFGRKKGGDPLVSMPIERYLSAEKLAEYSEVGWPTHRWMRLMAEVDPVFNVHVADPVGAITVALEQTYGEGYSEADNAVLSEQQHRLRREITSLAKRAGINLQKVAQGELSLFDDDQDESKALLRGLLAEHHDVAVELATKNWPLVIHSLNLLRETELLTGEDMADLVQEGMMGAVYAAKRYNPKWGFVFASYATPCIVGFMNSGRGQLDSVRVPEYAQRLGRLAYDMQRWYHRLTGNMPDEKTVALLVNVKVAKLAQGDETDPSLSELADLEYWVLPSRYWSSSYVARGEVAKRRKAVKEMISTRKTIRRVQRAQRDVSFADAVQTNYRDFHTGEWTNGEMTYGELLRFYEGESLDDTAVDQEFLRREIGERLNRLEPLQALVLKLFFGLGGNNEEMELKQVAKKVGLSLDKTRQVAAAALRKLQKPQHSRRLRQFLE